MKIKFLLFVLIVFLPGLSGLVCAQPFQDMGGFHEGMMQDGQGFKGNSIEKIKARVKEELGLDDVQQQKLDEHRAIHREQSRQYIELTKTLREQLKTELEKTDLDIAKIHSIHEQLKTINNQMADHRLEGILQVREILTAEQFNKFFELKERRKSRVGQKRMHRRMHEEGLNP
ncbi:MAG: Spy/CpxP family protein refolding chaperone [Candidatus Omnitrophota bacterium]